MANKSVVKKQPQKPPDQSPQSDQVSVRTWIALFGAMLGAFRAVLDIQITNSSLQQISGALVQHGVNKPTISNSQKP